MTLRMFVVILLSIVMSSESLEISENVGTIRELEKLSCLKLIKVNACAINDKKEFWNHQRSSNGSEIVQMQVADQILWEN